MLRRELGLFLFSAISGTFSSYAVASVYSMCSHSMTREQHSVRKQTARNSFSLFHLTSLVFVSKLPYRHGNDYYRLLQAGCAPHGDVSGKLLFFKEAWTTKNDPTHILNSNLIKWGKACSQTHDYKYFKVILELHIGLGNLPERQIISRSYVLMTERTQGKQEGPFSSSLL